MPNDWLVQQCRTMWSNGSWQVDLSDGLSFATLYVSRRMFDKAQNYVNNETFGLACFMPWENSGY